jgi:membrane associated rhomboid family serine protease
VLFCRVLFKRQTTGSVVCASCGYLVGVNDDKCYHCGRRNPGLWGFAGAVRKLGNDMGFAPFVAGTCIVMFVLTLLASGGNIAGGGMMGFLSPNSQSLFLFGASGQIPVFEYHRWWTVLSAGWLHGGLLHILFNVLWIRQLAPVVGEFYGPGRMVIIYTAGAVLGFTATTLAGEYLAFLPFLQGAGITVGASAPIFGLLGALVYYGRRTGSRLVHGQALSWALGMFVFGLVMPHVDNYAHAGGFVGGYLAARTLDPLKPERINHIAGALICLALSILAIVASVLHAIWFVRFI